MKRCTWVVALALAGLAMVATSAFGAPAAPFDTNAECLECHSVSGTGAFTKVDFNVPVGVDYNRCKSCHQSWLFDQGHFHGYAYCGECHAGDGDAFAIDSPEPVPFSPWIDPAAVASSGYFPGYPVSTPSGIFATTQSLTANPSQLHAIHSGSNWVNQTELGPACDSCHAAAACSTCHGNVVPHDQHAVPEYPGLATKMSYGAGVGSAVTVSTCVDPVCHALSAAGTAGFAKPACGSCHAEKQSTHGYDTADHVADDGAVDGVACSACHALDLASEHAKPTASSAGQECATCHPTPRGSFGAWGQTCTQGGCHAAGSSTATHADISSGHAVSTSPAAAVCGDCHDGDLAGVHTDAVSSTDGSKTSCLVCHSTGSIPATNDCTVCHFTYDNHPYTAESHLSDSTLLTCTGSGCHSGDRDLLAAHQEKNPAFGCNDCHQSTDPSVVGAIDSGLTACSSCHADISETSGHLAQHYANPPLTLNGLPQYAYWTGSAPGGAYTTDCTTCHTSNVVYEHMGVTDELGNQMRPARKDRFGNDLTCDSCHASVDPNVMGAIATGMTNCDACHVVHGPIDTIHQSTFMVDPPMNCTQCHEASLPMEHNGGFSTTTPSGRVLVGCAVCHEYYEGDRGQQVEDAVAAGDSKCTACHSIHGAGDHTAPNSAECAACHETADAVAIHAGSPLGGCDVCHANPTGVPTLPASTDCVNCHAEVAPADPNHYAPTSHAANNGMEGSLACTKCHSLDMKAEHAGIVTCVECHELKVDGLTAAWDKSCTACHATKHADIDASHVGVTPAGNTCVGSYCHPNNSTELRAVHTDVGCEIAGCHAAGSTPGVKECATCHAGYVDGHKSSGPIAEPFDSCTGAGCHTVSTDIHQLANHPVECESCHGLDAELACVCHDKAQIHSYAPHTAAACTKCHPSGTSMPHGIITPKLTTASTRSQWRAVCDDCHGYVHDRGTCTGCHSLSKLHSLDSRHVDSNSDCSKCHTIPSADLTDPCITCHPKGAQAVTPPGSGATPGPIAEPFSGCTNCHASNAEVHRVASHPKECMDCHGVAQADACSCHTEAAVHAVSQHASADCAKCHESGVPKPHTTITVKTTSSASRSTWIAACDDCHSRPHDRGTCSNCHSPSGLHGEASNHVDSNSDCKSCHGIQSADLSWNCLACHKNLGSSSSGSDGGWGDSGGSWGGR